MKIPEGAPEPASPDWLINWCALNNCEPIWSSFSEAWILSVPIEHGLSNIICIGRNMDLQSFRTLLSNRIS